MADFILREYFLRVYFCSCESRLLLLRHFNAPGVLLLPKNCILRLSLIPTSEASNPEFTTCPRPGQNNSKISPNLLYFSGKHSWKTESGPGCAVRRTTFDHFGQIFRFFLEFGAHERRWRFLYSKTWQLYKVGLSFPERYAQFLMNFRQYFSKWSFWTQNQRGYPLPKFDFRPIFHFGMVWGGKCDFGMNLQWIVQCFDEEWGFYLQKYQIWGMFA